MQLTSDINTAIQQNLREVRQLQSVQEAVADSAITASSPQQQSYVYPSSINATSSCTRLAVDVSGPISTSKVQKYIWVVSS